MKVEMINTIIAEVAPLIDAREVVFLSDADSNGDLIGQPSAENCWYIGFEEEPSLLLEPEGVHDRFVISGEVANLPTEGRLKLLQTLMIYNNQRVCTGGTTMAVDGESGIVTMAVPLDPEDIEKTALAETITDFRKTRLVWAEVISKWDGGTDISDSEQPTRSAEELTV